MVTLFLIHSTIVFVYIFIFIFYLCSFFFQFPLELDPWEDLKQHIMSDYLNHEVS